MAITPRQFEQMQSRLANPKRGASPVFEASYRPRATNEIIIGIDPSLRGTGYGVIQLGKPHARVLAHGTISCPPGWEHSRCLLRISQTLREILVKCRPQVCAIEGLFFAQNLQTALTMGQARGAALAVLAEAGLEIYEIAPRKVKQAIVGYGAAQKIAVAKMVQRMLQLPALPSPDAADALAIAIAHSQENTKLGIGSLKKI